MKNRVIFGIILLCMIIPAIKVRTYAGEPAREKTGWSWQETGGSRLKDQFAVIDGENYYFDSDGFLVTDRPVNIGEELYYFDENGRCAKNLWKYMETQENENASWYFFTSSGKAFRDGWISIDEKKYHFTDHKMDHGWYTEENDSGSEAVYYLGGENEGAAVSGWLAWKGADLPGGGEREVGWYYFLPGSCQMVSNRETEIDGFRYAFNGDGRMAAGFVSVNGKEKYYDPATGRQAEGWFYIGETEYDKAYREGWYYFDAGLALRAGKGTVKLAEYCGTAKIDGYHYGFDESGRMLTGVVFAENGKYYCFGKDGRLATGTIDISELETTGCTSSDLPSDTMLFGSRGSSPPALGAAVSGTEGEYVYRNGVRLRALHDTYEQVETETEGGKQTYIVDEDGKIKRTGIVVLKNGEKKKVVRHDGSYSLE